MSKTAFYKLKSQIIVILIFTLSVIVSCSKSASRYDKEINLAEKLMQSSADSALGILETIDPIEIKEDSLSNSSLKKSL